MTQAEWAEARAMKKEFQKVIKAIRDDRSEQYGRKFTYPKPMMTEAQIAKRTATVNCGGEWVRAETAKATADLVMTDIRFVKFLKDNRSAHIELDKFGRPQIRINF